MVAGVKVVDPQTHWGTPVPIAAPDGTNVTTAPSIAASPTLRTEIITAPEAFVATAETNLLGPEASQPHEPAPGKVPPEGVVNIGGDWYFEEFSHGRGVSSVGTEDTEAVPQAPTEEEKKSILDLFR